MGAAAVALDAGAIEVHASVMTLLGLIVVIVIVGFLLWLVGTIVPMEPRVRQILIGVVLLILMLWIVQQLGLVEAFDRPILRHR